jgi:hypothetical protein
MTHGADWPPENAIVALFRQRVAAENEADALGQRDAEDGTPERAEFNAATERTTDLADAIVAIPSRGPVGLAIKVYLRHRFAHGGRYGDRPAMLGEFEADCTEAALERSIIEERCISWPSSPRSPLLSDPAGKRLPDAADGRPIIERRGEQIGHTDFAAPKCVASWWLILCRNFPKIPGLFSFSMIAWAG